MTIVGNTSDVQWTLDLRADSVDYIGRKVPEFGVVYGYDDDGMRAALSGLATKLPRATSAGSTTSTR